MSKEVSNTLAFIGGTVATALSWITNHSVGWAILHFFCGWLYVLFHLIVYGWHR